MQRKLLEILCCPKCFADLECVSEKEDGIEILEGILECSVCKIKYPIEEGIPRFVDKNNYSSSFGYQWNEFKGTQLDSKSGTTQSADRFYSETGWTSDWLKGKWILDAGCGAGRFLDVVSQNDCEVVGIDISSAIEASKKNLADRKNVHFVQASIYELPFREGAFDGCYCIGVVQHTPNPAKTLESISRLVKKGGQLVVTIYERKPWTMLYSKFWLRPLTRRMKDETLLKTIRFIMPVAFPVTDVLFRVPVLKKVCGFLIPIANYVDKKDLSRKQRYEWAILDTFDMLAPQYDQPQTEPEVVKTLSEAGIGEIERLPNPGLNLVGRK
ncbi:MAG TPA: methyltransferase domain-containing protein [Pyrinomonadaceae bacterium]|nr:methyltransferase domain-containing protein [Pyrinomonadaceae bacterium]